MSSNNGELPADRFDELADFARRSVGFGDLSYDVYVAGSGPAVVVLPEIPGITPHVADFARRVIAAGFSAWIPSLFGTPGRPATDAYAAASLAKACVRREFMAFARGKRAPVTRWMRDLVALAHKECGGPGVGVVGMCFTGNFALALAVDPLVLAPVMSQPSLPLGLSKKSRGDLHVAPDDVATIKARTVNEDLCVMGLRFTADPLVPEQRFERLRAEFGDAFIGVEIDSGPANQFAYTKRSHSVLAAEYSSDPTNPTNHAFQQVLNHLRKKLQP